MKTTKKTPLSFYILSLVIALTFTTILSTNNFGQNASSKSKVMTVYVISDAKEQRKITRPRITVVKNNTVKASRTAFDLEITAFQLINQKRAEQGLGPLQWSDKIANLAREHSLNMADYKFFSHQGLNGRLIDERANAFGIVKWKAISENIAFNKGLNNPVEFAVERWMISNGHRQNLLNSRWQQSGIGVAVSQDGAYYFTQIFLDK